MVKGIAPEDLKALYESSAGEIDALLRIVSPEALEATRGLLQALQAGFPLPKDRQKHPVSPSCGPGRTGGPELTNKDHLGKAE